MQIIRNIQRTVAIVMYVKDQTDLYFGVIPLIAPIKIWFRANIHSLYIANIKYCNDDKKSITIK